MPDQSTLDAVANAELDHLIATTMQLLGASTAYDLKPRDQTGSTTLFGEYKKGKNGFEELEQQLR
jgi:hypothetical protein